jgi:hypothetical protein
MVRRGRANRWFDPVISLILPAALLGRFYLDRSRSDLFHVNLVEVAVICADPIPTKPISSVCRSAIHLTSGKSKGRRAGTKPWL